MRKISRHSILPPATRPKGLVGEGGRLASLTRGSNREFSRKFEKFKKMAKIAVFQGIRSFEKSRKSRKGLNRSIDPVRRSKSLKFFFERVQISGILVVNTGVGQKKLKITCLAMVKFLMPGKRVKIGLFKNHSEKGRFLDLGQVVLSEKRVSEGSKSCNFYLD